MAFDNGLYTVKEKDYYNQSRQEMLEFIPLHVKSVLDVGCSSGGFGKLLKEKRNCEVWGIEPTESAFIADTYLDKVYHDFFHPKLDFENKKFDAIIFNDVLEHLINPWETLLFSKSLLKDREGYIIASIPNIQCYSVLKNLIIHGDWKYTSSGILDKTHLRFFTKKSIIRLFNDTGYTIINIKGQNSILQGSKLLRILHLFMPQKTNPFTFVNYGVCAKID